MEANQFQLPHFSFLFLFIPQLRCTAHSTNTLGLEIQEGRGWEVLGERGAGGWGGVDGHQKSSAAKFTA